MLCSNDLSNVGNILFPLKPTTHSLVFLYQSQIANNAFVEEDFTC